MQINRTLLYVGIFLVAVGGVVVAADLTAVDNATLVGVLGLWPLALIAIGLGLVLRRTRASLGGGLLAAAVPGLLLGSAFAAMPRISGFCTSDDGGRGTQQGAFDGPASVSVRSDCGTLNVSAAAGNAWRLVAPDVGGRVPVVDSTARSLSIGSTGHEGWPGAGRDDWNLTLPTSELADLSFNLNAGRGDIDLAGAAIDRLSVNGNAAEIHLNASAASIGSLNGEVNVGLLSIHLPEMADLSGSVKVDVGQLQVCVPPTLGLRLTASGDAREVKVDGVKWTPSVWQSPGYASADHHATLDVQVNLGGVEINPIGGCK